MWGRTLATNDIFVDESAMGQLSVALLHLAHASIAQTSINSRSWFTGECRLAVQKRKRFLRINPPFYVT